MASSSVNRFFRRLHRVSRLHPPSSATASPPATSRRHFFNRLRPSNDTTFKPDDARTVTDTPPHGHDDTLLLLNTMATQGPTSLAAKSISFDPVTSLGDVERLFADSEGFISATISQTHTDRTGRILQDFVFEFNTATDAAQALARHPEISIANRTYPVVPHNGEFGDPQYRITDPDRPSILRSRKRAKVEWQAPDVAVCKICFEEIPDNEPYSTPCRRCHDPCCYTCLAEDFRSCLTDMNRFPVKCCSTVVHHSVARGILPAGEFEIYKSKMDEMNDANPVYCPVPTCSAFIPRRMFKANDTKVKCHVCETLVCAECKQLAVEGHTCSKDASRDFIIDTFQYKPCPRCGTGIMRMYGCDHIRCKCGAHWCWECCRPFLACQAKPCRAARDMGHDGEQSGGEEEDDAQSTDDSRESTEPQAAAEMPDAEPQVRPGSTTGAMTVDHTAAPGMTALFTAIEIQAAMSQVSVGVEASIVQPPAPRLSLGPLHEAGTTELDALERVFPPIEVNVPETVAPDPNGAEPTVTAPENLDDPDEIDWEVQSIDFGEEPSDESWDVWGCRHHFRELGTADIPKYWLVGVDPSQDETAEVECMACFKKARLSNNAPAAKKEDGGHGETAGDRADDRAGNVDKAAARKKTPKVAAAKKEVQAFDCRLCGIVYCRSCRNAARKRIKKERQPADG